MDPTGYFLCVMAASVCGALCSALGDGAFSGSLRFVCSLVCLCIILSPVFSGGERELPTAEELFDSSRQELLQPDLSLSLTAALTEEKTEEYICQLVLSRFGIKPVGCRIDIDWSTEPAEITCISVTADVTEESAEAISKYLFEELGGEVTVVGA